MDEKKTNTYVRTLIICLSGFVIWIISYSFLSLEPAGTISTGIITLIVLLVVIVLSESFDNFSVGKLLTMNREIKTKETSITRLNNENNELRKELVNVVTSISQNQSSTNIIGFPDELARKMGVEKATDEEITNKRSEESEEETSTTQSRPARARINPQKLEQFAFGHFLKGRNLADFDLIEDAKLVTQFSGIDAISNIQPIYDGYLNTGESEIFVEVKPSRVSPFIMRERIYLMLNKIYLYNKVKKANAHLNLLLVNVSSDDSEKLRSARSTDRLKEFFEPAIVSGLFKIIPIDLTEEELTQLYESN